MVGCCVSEEPGAWDSTTPSLGLNIFKSFVGLFLITALKMFLLRGDTDPLLTSFGSLYQISVLDSSHLQVLIKDSD